MSENLLHDIKRIKEEEALKEKEKNKKADDEDEKQREKELERERVEVLKIRNGLSAPAEDNKDVPYKPMTFKDKIENFFYHYKLVVICSAIVLAFCIYSVYSYVTQVTADGDLLYITQTFGVSTNYTYLQDDLSRYCPDFNNDGHNYFHVSYNPIDVDQTSDSQTYQANIIKFMTSIDSADTMLIIANDKQDGDCKFANSLVDLRELYPDNEKVGQFGFYLKGTKFADILQIDDDKIDDHLFIGIRKVTEGKKYTEKMKKTYEVAMTTLDGFIKEMSE